MNRLDVAWCVYILSNNAHTLYVGSTNDLLRRLPEHGLRKHPTAFTARYTFDRCVYYEFVADETAARAREKCIKGWTRAKKIALIENGNPWWNDLTPDLLDLLRLR
ncbi:MAG TPA: GIY-YIG nuclease family protein [Thermoanaerobaculia bacterium]|nr:GIY-YIG nuclease family protein [Thermoanaerobaculia bacterium]